jgi:alginate O-acetyltransferase complex protein AlgI
MAGSGAPMESTALWNAGLSATAAATWCAALGALAVLAPNSNRIGQWLLDTLSHAGWVRIAAATAGACVVLGLVLLNAVRDSVSAFIYFNF